MSENIKRNLTFKIQGHVGSNWTHLVITQSFAEHNHLATSKREWKEKKTHHVKREFSAHLALVSVI